MKAWIVLMSITLGSHSETHALGYFLNEDACRRWASMYSTALLAKQESGTVIGICWTEAEFRRLKPDMRLELRDS
jgi:hypothetical protein